MAAAVIKGWADALRAGHPRQAAAYWAHPSVMVNGPDSTGHFTLIRIRTVRDALIADETLSCAATLRGTSRSGAYVQADFTLSTRTAAGAISAGCSGPARVNFLIGGSHILRWLRAPLASSPPQGGGSGQGGEGESSRKGAGPLSI